MMASGTVNSRNFSFVKWLNNNFYDLKASAGWDPSLSANPWRPTTPPQIIRIFEKILRTREDMLLSKYFWFSEKIKISKIEKFSKSKIEKTIFSLPKFLIFRSKIFDFGTMFSNFLTSKFSKITRLSPLKCL